MLIEPLALPLGAGEFWHGGIQRSSSSPTAAESSMLMAAHGRQPTQAHAPWTVIRRV